MAKSTELEKLGWRVNEWAAAVGISRASVYELIAAKTIDSVKFGGARLITTLPRDFLASLKDPA
jgi:excisionase family DNA binding protein